VRNTGRTSFATACCLIVVLLAGCAALSSLNTKQETLEERVNNFMQAQIDGKWDQAYSFFHSSYREKVSKEKYVNQTRKLSYKKFTIEEISVLPPGNEATVKVRIDLSFMGLVFPRAPQKQDWAKENGGWFIKWSDKEAPFPRRQKQK
jgi:hypothetical protein